MKYNLIMLPINLKIKGLYSYQNEQSIDFTELMKGQLFGIFGGVGSGKSSILEAIGFALYDNTERLSNRGDQRNFNMMNLRSNELFIEFDFRNYQNTIYRCVVQGKRSSRNYDTVPTFNRRYFVYDNNTWIPIEKFDATEIVGLSYENFRRTIIIPQGKFQEFLNLTAADKTRMLMDIFHLERFDLYQQTRRLISQNNENLNLAKGERNSFGDLTPEKIGEYSNQVEILRAEYQRVEIEFNKLQSEKNRLEELKKRYEKLEAIKIRLNNLKDKEPEISKNKIHLERWEEANNLFKNLTDRLGENKRELDELQVESDALKVMIHEKGRLLFDKSENLKDLESKILTIDRSKEDTNKIRQQKKVIERQALKEDVDARISKGNDFIEEINQTLSEINMHIKSCEELNEGFEKALEIKDTIAILRTWFAEKNHLEKRVVELKSEIQTRNEAKNHKRSKILDVLSSTNIRFDIDQAYSHHELEDIFLISTLNKKKIEYEESLTKLEVQLELSKYAESLSSGVPCPLCGSLEHPHINHFDDVKAPIHPTRSALSEINDLIKYNTDLLFKYRTYTQSCKDNQDGINELQLKLEEAINVLLQHQENFQGHGLDISNEISLNSAIDKILKTEKDLKTSRLDLDNKRKEKKILEEKKDKSKSKLERLKLESNILEGEIKSLQGQFDSASIEECKHLSIEELDVRLGNLESYIEQTELNYKSLIHETSILKEEIVKIQASNHQKEVRIKTLIDASKIIDNQLNELLETSFFESIEDVQKLLCKQIDTAGIKKEILEYEAERNRTEGELTALNNDIEGQVFDSVEFDETGKLFKEIENQFKLANEKYIESRSFLENKKADFVLLTHLDARIDKFEIRAANLNQLAKLFSGSGFVNFVSTIYLQNLCEIANERFYKLTRQQLRLELGVENSFMVRDFLNEGKVRHIKTLSGGQTFQAALCLALALAESIQSNSKTNQNFFFLDEGFGSLDKDSLNIVFETLKSLQQDKRVVGIISHVEELQQDIDVYLTVKNDPENGSLIRASYEN